MALAKKSKKPAKKPTKAAKPAKAAARKKPAERGASQQLEAQRRAIENGLCPSCFKANRTSFKLCAKCRKLKRGYMQRLRDSRKAATAGRKGKKGAKK
ncbi:MAG TPA: hypothetical protein VGH90_03405 [Chthoniobacteraceae bacterium]|jgi:hypothetical protein